MIYNRISKETEQPKKWGSRYKKLLNSVYKY
ncbi:hypothetical protein ACUXGI_001383 [Staphylococcus hominis]